MNEILFSFSFSIFIISIFGFFIIPRYEDKKQRYISNIFLLILIISFSTLTYLTLNKIGNENTQKIKKENKETIKTSETDYFKENNYPFCWYKGNKTRNNIFQIFKIPNNLKFKIMAHKKKFKKRPSINDLKKVGEKWMGNSVTAKIEENPEPEFRNDEYRANVRIYPDFKTNTNRTKKSAPILAVYNANMSDLDLFQHSLVSAIISIQNVKKRLAEKNNEELEENFDFI